MGLSLLVHVIWSLLMTFQEVSASENVASGKVTNQSSDHGQWDSSKAVDKCELTYFDFGCCAHTAEGQNEAWWQVDLQTLSVIETVNIIYRDEDTLDRLAGYEIYLSDTSDWTTGNRCHKDTTAELASMSSTQNVQCPGVARYLTIYNDRRVKAKPWYSDTAILELCEVQVHGCPVGRYGIGNCNNHCKNCVNSMCDTRNGTCDECTSGYYKVGGTCNLCPVNCAGNKCDNRTAVCSDGCLPGFSGLFCRCPVNCGDSICATGRCTECNNGYYGPDCTPCPSGCSTVICNKTSGHCNHGCSPGFSGLFCRCPVNCGDSICAASQCTDCNNGFYGPACTPCPSGCSTDTCNKTSGQCVHCVVGYHGIHCDENCPSNCKHELCNQTDGQCIECISGFHGSKCSERCGYCQDGRCDKDTGKCMSSCKDGLTGDMCDVKVVNVPSNGDDFKPAAMGIGIGSGVVIVALIIVIIVQARRQHLGRQQNTARSTPMTNISLSSIGQELHTKTDGTYDVIDTQRREEGTRKEYQMTTDDKYERLGQKESEVPHIYENK